MCGMTLVRRSLAKYTKNIDLVPMEYGYAMIGGPPFLMSTLESSLSVVGVTPCYAFSKRVSVDETQPDGSVKKTAVFKHEDFIMV